MTDEADKLKRALKELLALAESDGYIDGEVCIEIAREALTDDE